MKGKMAVNPNFYIKNSTEPILLNKNVPTGIVNHHHYCSNM